MTKLHTPYDGSSKPFTVGLNPLDLSEWMEIDERLSEYLAEKDLLLSERHADICMAEADTTAAQHEVLQLLLAYLPERYPDIYREEDGGIAVLPTGETYLTDEFADRPLELASRLVQEDLVLLRPSPDGHRIVAACVCFPSEWSLKEKFGKALADVHKPVPGLGRGTRNAGMIERIFSNLKAERPVERFNWFLLRNPALFLPELECAKGGLFDAEGKPHFWLRVERQTLRRLPQSGDILFTIRICVDPFARLQNNVDARSLARAMRQQIADLDPDQLAYKGLAPDCAAVLAELDRIAGSA